MAHRPARAKAGEPAGVCAVGSKCETLITSIYGGTLEEHPWKSFMMLLRDELRAKYVTLMLRPPRPGDTGVVLNAVIASPQANAAYNESLHLLDPFVDLPYGQAIALADLVSGPELLRSDYYRFCLKPLGVRHVLGIDFGRNCGTVARLRISRSAAQGAFSPQDAGCIGSLLPHLELAVQLHARIRATEVESTLYADAIASMQFGAIFLDAELRVIKANAKALELLQERRGVGISSGRLTLASEAGERRLRQVLMEVVESGRRGVPAVARAFALPSDTEEARPALLIRPMEPLDAASGRRPAVVVFISDPSRGRCARASVLMELYGLSAKEAALALLLANGSSIDEAASQLSVSRNTVKTHVNRIFEKTSTSRHAQLVRLIHGSVATIA